MAGDVAQSTMDGSLPVAKYVPALAPVLLVAIGYMDPGNWACAIEGGSRFGFELLWVVIVSNVMAALFQNLAVRLGLVSGKHLAEICREDYPRPVCLLLWLLSELSIISLDLTMVAGTAIGLNLLFEFPVFPSVLVLAFDGIIVMLFLPIVGVHRAELVAGSVVGFALVCFGLGALISKPSASAMLSGLWPIVRGDSLYTAVGLIGANVVPHTFYLHSALLQKQHTLVGQSKDDVVQENMRDTLAAFGIALMANVAVLVVSASTFHNVGLVIMTLQDAHALMEQILSNSIAPMVFGLALLCAGQLSSLTGTLTGKVTMEGFLDMSMQPWLHRSLVRAVAVIPAAFCAWRYGSEGLYRLLLFSQILIAVELPFSAVPLIKSSASEARMGSYRISSLVESTAWISVGLVVVANIWLVFDLLLQEINELGGFAAHVEKLLGTDSFGHYGGGTVNTSVFALVLIGIGLCLGFLVWLVVTPLRVDRIAMERKWVLEYELFERNERENQELVQNRLALLEFSPGSTTADEDYDMIPLTEDIMLASDLVALEYPRRPEIVLSGEDSEPALEPVAWPSSLSTSGSDIDEDCSNKQFGMLKLFDTSKANGMIRPLEFDKASELFISLDDMLDTASLEGAVISLEDEVDKTSVLVDSEPPVHVAVSSGKTNVYEPVLHDFNEKPREKDTVEESLLWVVEDGTKNIEGSSLEHDRAHHVLTEPEIAGTIETFLKDTSFSANEMEESCRPRAASGPTKPRTHVSMAADDVESIALKKAEAEADADTIGKDEDDADDMEAGDVVAGPLSHGNLGHSYGNPAYDGPGSARSLGARSDVSECNAGGSGSGSSSRLSGLGRAARRQFAAHLDEFWGKLFDLHGQSIASKGSSSSVRSTSAMGSAAASSFEPSITPRSVDSGAFSGRPSSLDYLDRDSSSGYPSKRGVSKSTSSLQQQVNQMEAYVRAHSNSNASTSSGFPGLTRGYSGSTPYLAERQYSSLRLPIYSEEVERQPATIHGYYAPSFLGRSATSSPAHKLSRPMALDMSSARALSGQAHAQQPLGIGVEREFEGSQLYGGGYQASLEDTIRNLRSSQHSMNALATRSYMSYKPSIDRDLDGPRSLDSRMFERTTVDPLLYRATGEFHMPSSGCSPIGRLGYGSDERAPLSFDEISPLSRRDGFSIQSAQQENSLSSRQPFEQLFGGAVDNGGRSRNSASLGPSRSGGGGGGGSMGRSVRPSSDSFSNNATSFGSGSDVELETMENLKACVCKLLGLDGSEWLFRVDNGSDEDLIAAISAVEKMYLEEDAPDRSSSRWQAHGRPVSSLSKTSSDARRVCYCGDTCIWGKGLLVSFGVWCVHRVLELSLIESRPELWGKYTYVLNRLQGILEPAFSKPRIVPAMCSCVLEAGSDILSKRGGRGGLIKQGSSALRDTSNGDLHGHLSSAQTSTYPYPWPWGRNSSSSKGRGASAAVFLEMIKEVEQAVGSRKGRTGTAAGDVAFPKGKENLASVLKRYKRRLGNKPPGATVGGGGGSGGGGGGGGRNSRSNGYAQALVFAACLSFVLLPPC